MHGFGEHTNHAAPKSLDFIGLNHYSLGIMNDFTKGQHPDTATHTANKNYCISPESLYLAIKEISNRVAEPLNIPIYITKMALHRLMMMLKRKIASTNIICLPYQEHSLKDTTSVVILPGH